MQVDKKDLLLSFFGIDSPEFSKSNVAFVLQAQPV